MALFLSLFLSGIFAGQFLVAPDTPVLPDIQVELTDVIDVLTEYNVLQETNPTFCRNNFGMTDSVERTITICVSTDITHRRITLLHEILHVLYWRKGISTGGPYETQIDEKAHALFYRLYGVKSAAHQEAKIPPIIIPKIQ